MIRDTSRVPTSTSLLVPFLLDRQVPKVVNPEPQHITSANLEASCPWFHDVHDVYCSFASAFLSIGSSALFFHYQDTHLMATQ